VLGFVGDESAEVAAYDAVPGGAVLLVEVCLDVLRYILLLRVRLQGSCYNTHRITLVNKVVGSGGGLDRRRKTVAWWQEASERRGEGIYRPPVPCAHLHLSMHAMVIHCGFKLEKEKRRGKVIRCRPSHVEGREHRKRALLSQIIFESGPPAPVLLDIFASDYVERAEICTEGTLFRHSSAKHCVPRSQCWPAWNKVSTEQIRR
jgi:hypothetical protein